MRIDRPKVSGSCAIALALAFVAGCSSSTVSSTSPPSPSTEVTTTTVHDAKPLACPARAPEKVAAHPIAGTAATVVPGQPTALLACRYHGFNQSQPIGSLAASARIAPGPIATALNGATVIPKGAVYNCPADFGESILLIFGYPNGSRLDVLVSNGGCRFTNNGDRIVQTSGATLLHLEAVLGHDNTP